MRLSTAEMEARFAQIRACNPGLSLEEAIQKGIEEQTRANQITGLPGYYNPSVINPVKIAENERKKKLLWGSKVCWYHSVSTGSISGYDRLLLYFQVYPRV